MLRSFIVIPCYNEADRLNVAAFQEFAAERGRASHGESADSDTGFLFVDDGSSDSTAQVLQSLHESCPNTFQALYLQRNSGKAEAVRQGMLRAFESDARYVGFWDADLATPLADIEQFAAVLDDNPTLQTVFGSRVNLLGRSVRRNLLRHYIGRVFATLAAAVLRLGVYDTQCGAKLFRNTSENCEIFESPFLSRWIFDVEIVARLITRYRSSSTPSIREVIFEYPLMRWDDVAGSKLTLFDFFVVGLDLWRINWHYYVRR